MKGPIQELPEGYLIQGRLTGRRRWSLGALLAQLFLISAYVSIIASDLPIGTKVWSIAVLLMFSAFYILVPGRCVFSPMRVKIAVIGTLLLLTIPLFVVMGSSAAVLWIFAAVAGGLLFPDWAAMGLGLALAGGMLVVDQVYGDPLGWELALTTVAMTAFMVGFTGNVRLNVELRRTREELAKVAVAAERERIGRDLHDILGHSLTAIAVKAGLARRLVGRDDAAAAAEIGEVEKLAREALADVRATASGFREVSLDSQLAVARSVLRAAGITANLPATVDEVDPSMRELFGYVVREAVTNVVRHAHATTCTVTVGPGMVEIVNDDLAVGAGAATRLPSAPGSGLTGLAERVRAAGGTLVAGPLAGGGFSLRATVPVPRPVPTGRPSTAGRR
ncbi:MAG TPA: sensor histidine kinase [Nakamurella sp.]|jgi:two-component system sensor histidine kinase DesK